MSDRRVKERAMSAERGYARGGSEQSALKRKFFIVESVRVLVLSILICAAIVALIASAVTLTVKDLSFGGRDNVSVYYGDMRISTDADDVYDGSAVCIDMNCVADMLSLVIIRDGNSVTYSTAGGDRIDLTVGENTVVVNGIKFSLAAKTRDVKGKIFASSEIVDRFISDSSVVVSKKENTVSVIALEKDPSEIFFSPKKSGGMSGIDRPSSLPKETSYDPEGTAPPKVTAAE